MKHLVHGVAFVAVLSAAPIHLPQAPHQSTYPHHRRRQPPPPRQPRPGTPRQLRGPSGPSATHAALGTRALTHTTATTVHGDRRATTLLMS
jgi:hypothetical protein